MARKRAFRVTNGTFTHVVNQYLASPKFLSLAPNTQDSYRRMFRMAGSPDQLGALRVEAIRPSMVQAFLDTLAHHPATQKNARKAIKSLETWGIVRDKFPHHITTGTEAKGGEGSHTPWPEEMVTLAERCARPHLARVVTLASNTGQRGSDLVRMRWDHIEHVDGHPGINVTQQKTGLVLWVPFTQELINVMSSWDQQGDYLAPKQDGEPFTRGQLSSQWLQERDLSKALAPLRDPPLVLHGLRGTAVVRLRRLGVSIPLICDMVGMSPQMVKRYSRKSEQRENALAAVRIMNAHRPGRK